jgi:hypothetical protein
MKSFGAFIRRGMMGVVLVAGLVSGTGFVGECLARSLDEQIAAARRDWLLGIATQERIAADLARYQASAQTSPEVVQLYETYLDRVRRLTEEKHRTLSRLEQQGTQQAEAGDPSPPTAPPGDRRDYDPQIPEDQELDTLSALDQEFNRSLAAFDDEMLREMEQSRVQSDLKMKKLAQEAAQAARSLREQGQTSGSADSESGMKEGRSSDGSGDETDRMSDKQEASQHGAEGPTGEADQEDARQASTGKGQDPTQSQGTSRETGGGEADPSGPGGVNTQDDDIVARQLREAAEKETDPELKAKLWKEYHDYKKTL